MWSWKFVLINFLTFGTEATAPVNVSVTVNEVPVPGRAEVTLAACTAASVKTAADVSWLLGTLSDSVKILTNIVKHLNGTFTVTSSLIATPTVQMNQQLAQCVIRHAMLNEELKIDHKIMVHYPPQLVTVTPLDNLSNTKVLQCEADGNPPATRFSWRSTPLTIPNDVIKTEGNKLYFLKLTSDLNGLYTCEASNEYGGRIGSLYWHKGDDLHDEL